MKEFLPTSWFTEDELANLRNGNDLTKYGRSWHSFDNHPIFGKGIFFSLDKTPNKKWWPAPKKPRVLDKIKHVLEQL
jgi:hypothetical protein